MTTQPDYTNSLKRKASRWQTLPAPGEETDTDTVDIDSSKYSLLLFLRDLNDSPNALQDFINGLQSAPG